MNYLTFIRDVGVNKYGKSMAHYKCICGNEKEISKAYVKSGHTKSCGCLQTIKNPEKYIGKVFNYLTFIEYVGKDSDGTHLAKFKCKCGNEKICKIYAVLKGQNKSCGCYKNNFIGEKSKTHGLSNHSLYSVWNGIIDRCTNESNKRYKDYGGRGVRMCDEWRNDFKSFYDWAIVNGWKKGLQIDKDIKAKKMGIEPLLYSPEWCSVVTHKENGNNTRTNRYITYEGKTLTISQWADKLGIKSTLIYKRLRRGWDIKKALFTENMALCNNANFRIRYSFGYIN